MLTRKSTHKNFPIPLLIKEMQIKTTLRHYFFPPTIRLAEIQVLMTDSVGEMVGKWTFSYNTGGAWICISPMEIYFKITTKIMIKLPFELMVHKI